MHGKKGNKQALVASENRLRASPTHFGKLMLHRALSWWLQLPDGITLVLTIPFYSSTSVAQVVSSLTKDLHFTAALNMCKEAEDQWQRLWEDHSPCSSRDIFVQKRSARVMVQWMEHLDWSSSCLRDAPAPVVCSTYSLFSTNMVLFFRTDLKNC